MKKNEKINWNKLSDGTLYSFLIDLSENTQKRIIDENIEYLVWADGSEISKEDLIADFMIIKNEKGVFSLTMNNEDFYINDIIFSE